VRQWREGSSSKCGIVTLPRISDLPSFLVNAGRSLYEVQKLLGHQDPKVTMRYAHLSPQAMLEAVNVVGNVVGRRAGVAANQAAVVVATM